MEYIVLALMLATLIGLIESIVVSNYAAVIILKTLTSILFVLLGFISYKKSKSNKKYCLLVLLGLIFSMFGDIFLVLEDHIRSLFYFGVIAFSIGHIMYVLSFNTCTKFKIKDCRVLAVIFSFVIILLKVEKFNFGLRYPFVLIYGIIISFMVCRALSLLRSYYLNKKWILITIMGVTLFFVSDLMLLFVMFSTEKHLFITREISLVLYYLGQALIAISLKQNIQLINN